MTKNKVNNCIRQFKFELLAAIMDIYESILPLLIEINLSL